MTRYYECDDGLTYFDGLKIVNLVNLNFRYRNHRLNLDIHRVEITERSYKLPISCISTKVHFIPQFKEKKAKFEFLKKVFFCSNSLDSSRDRLVSTRVPL